MQKRIKLRINDTEKEILQKIAQQNGYKDYHRFLHHQINLLPSTIKKNFCCKKEYKEQYAIPISNEIFVFIDKLACSHSTTKTSIILKYIIYPAIKKYMMEEEPLRL